MARMTPWNSRDFFCWRKTLAFPLDELWKNMKLAPIRRKISKSLCKFKKNECARVASFLPQTTWKFHLRLAKKSWRLLKPSTDPVLPFQWSPGNPNSSLVIEKHCMFFHNGSGSPPWSRSRCRAQRKKCVEDWLLSRKLNFSLYYLLLQVLWKNPYSKWQLTFTHILTALIIFLHYRKKQAKLNPNSSITQNNCCRRRLPSW